MSGSEFYDHTTYPSQGASGSSSAMRAELELIEAGFGKLPDLSGNGSKIVAINSGGTALEALTTTGTGSGVRATSPTFVTPVLGAATATTVNKITWTAPATGATVTVADGKTFTCSNTITLAGTDGSTLNIGSGGTLGTGAFTTAQSTFATSRVSTQFDVTSNTTVADVPGMSASLTSGQIYEFVARVFLAAGAGGGNRFAFAGTANAASYIELVTFHTTGGNNATQLSSGFGGETNQVSACRYVEIRGYFSCNGSGTFKMQFAQATSNATANSVLVGSTLTLKNIT